MRGGEVIRRALRWSGMSVEDLADRLGVDASRVAAWESGDPGFSVVEAAVGACGIDLHRLLAEHDPDPHDLALLDETLRLSVDERLDRMMRYVRFVEAGRSAMRAVR